MNGTPSLIPTEKQDLERLYYSADIPLETLTVGEYEIRINITDKTAKTSITKSETFQIK